MALTDEGNGGIPATMLVGPTGYAGGMPYPVYQNGGGNGGFGSDGWWVILLLLALGGGWGNGFGGGFGGGEAKPEAAPAVPGYSTAPGPAAQEQAETTIDFDSGSEFSRAIDGRDAYSVWAVMDELMEVLNATNPRLFNGVMRKIHEI